MSSSRNENPLPASTSPTPPTGFSGRAERFRGRTVIHRSTSGVARCRQRWRKLTKCSASFLNARAASTCIRQRNPATLSLVAIGGSRASVPAPEDERCADYLESLLTGQPYDHVARWPILAHHNARKYLDANNPHLPRGHHPFRLQPGLGISPCAPSSATM
ncbi:MAG: hypothetical protein MZV65_41490 [Chromatiales bacterium]|nr:hypothetical protein [Chromatiales bacterium]